ncbi:hypothetical protein O6H91_02G106200 [Diphasiastrum complanatum]|uniref:Uncharacterized protein n=1 Tax=Diphasiastrum complanatum TaxID=34168 RepID=A0ACC2EIT0_DIPCM|nr:hypothetical protein O6H91_02G106200 [Diphasiastrum complanatum]
MAGPPQRPDLRARGRRRGLQQLIDSEDATPRSAHLEVIRSSAQAERSILQLPTTVAPLNEVSKRMAKAASYLGRKFTNFVEEPVMSDTGDSSSSTARLQRRFSSNEMVPSLSGDIDAQVSVSSQWSTGNRELPSSESNTLSNLSFERATAMFTSTGAAVKEFSQNFLNSSPVAWQGLMSRVQTTIRGSADDIGWLQKSPSRSPVKDGTGRFCQLLEMTKNGVHKLPDTFVYLLVPGLFSNLGPLYFVDTKKYFSGLGLNCYIARIHSEAAVETNARELKDYIEELYWGSRKRIMLLGHSKGGVDAAAAIAMFWTDLKEKVAGLVLVQSPFGGSPIAADILREGQIADLETRRILELFLCKIIKGDMRALEDLTYQKRHDFLSKYSLPAEFPIVSFHTEASKAPGVISTLSHIAHAELPWLSMPTGSVSEESTTGTRVPVVIPLAAVMAALALHLEFRYGEKSDGLVCRKDAEVPGSVVVKPERKLDHAWMVYSKGSDAPQMCEALITLLLEQEKKS